MSVVVDNVVIRELPTGRTHFGQGTFLSAGEENAWGFEQTDLVTIGPHNAETFPMGLISITTRPECPADAIDHSQE